MSTPLGDEARRLLSQALALPEDQRVTLVGELVASLPEDPEDPAVVKEIEQRFARYERGETRTRPWSEVRADVEARMRQLRQAG